MGGKTQLQLEKEDKERDAAFNKAMHGKTAAQANSVATILFKNPEAKQAALDAYFKHFDNKKADNETEADRKVCLAAFLGPATRSCSGATPSSYPFSHHVLTTDSLTGTNRRVRHIDKTVSTPLYLRDSSRDISEHFADLFCPITATTTLLPTSTSSDGASRSTSAVSQSASPSTKPLPAMSTTLHTRSASRRACRSLMLAAVSVDPHARSPSSPAQISPD